MALDLIDGRELYEVIKSSPPLSPTRIKNILIQLLDAIDKIHEVGILHRDISPDNILIEESGTPVLIDFGAARADAHRDVLGGVFPATGFLEEPLGEPRAGHYTLTP